MLNKEDLTLDQASTREEQWSYYVDSYYMHADTEGVATDLLAAPWIRRTAFPNDFPEDSDSSVSAGELQVKICLNTYKLFYLVNTEDTLVRGKRSRTIQAKILDYYRAARKADGAKWTQHGYVTKEEQDAAEAAAEVREQQQQIVLHSTSAREDVQPSTTPAPTDVRRSPEASLPPAVSDDPAPSDVKLESPPAPVDDDAMDVASDPAPVPEPLEPVSVNDDVDMPDA